jgi:hypothetical protein
LIGRGDGVDVRARGWGVRPLHARVTRSGGGRIELTCFGKARATVNGERVQSSRLEVGDRVKVGSSEYRISDRPPV